MSTKFETLFGIKEAVSQEDIDDLKNFRGEKHKLFQILNRRFEYTHKDINSKEFNVLQDILYNVCKYVDPSNREKLLKTEDPLKPFQHQHILNLYHKLVDDGNSSLAANLALLDQEKAEWLEHQLKELYAHNQQEVADSLSYDLYDMIFSDNKHVTKFDEPFAFVKNKQLLDFFNKLNFNPELQTAFLLLSDDDKYSCYKQFLKHVNDLYKNKESQNNEEDIDALLQSFKHFHDDNKLKPVFRDESGENEIYKNISKNFYNELSTDFSREQFLKLSDDMRIDIALLPTSIARNLLDNTAKNEKLFRVLMIMEDYVRHKDSSKSILEKLPEKYYHIFATNKDFRKDYIDNLFGNTEVKEAAETKKSIDAQVKKQKEDELKKIDQDNRNALRKASDEYAKQQYSDQNSNETQGQPKGIEKLQDIDSHVDGFLNAYYERDKNIRKFVISIPTNDILDICELCNNNISKIFTTLTTLFKQNVLPSKLLQLPEDIQQFSFDNIFTIKYIIECIKQQEAYGIPSTGNSPNVNKFVNRYIQLYKSNDQTLADKYAVMSAEDKLTLEAFIRDYSKSQKLGSEIIRFLNSDQEKRDTFEFDDTPTVSKTIKQDDQNNDVTHFDNSSDAKLLDLANAYNNELSELITIAQETDKLKFIYKRTNKSSNINEYFDSILAFLNSIPSEESTEFFNTLTNKADESRFYKAILFLILKDSKERAFVLHNCTNEDAEYLCKLQPQEENKNVLETINNTIDEVIKENEGKIDFSFKISSDDSNKLKPVEKQTNITNYIKNIDYTSTKNTNNELKTEISIAKRYFPDDILEFDSDEVRLFKTTLDDRIQISELHLGQPSVFFDTVIDRINKKLKHYKFIKGSIDTSKKNELDSFKSNILKVKEALETAQSKIDEINKLRLQSKTTNTNESDKIAELSNEIYNITSNIANVLGDSSQYNKDNAKVNIESWNKIGGMISKFKTLINKDSNIVDFRNLTSLQKDILDTTPENAHQNDFRQAIDECDKFYKLADSGFLNSTGVNYLNVLIKINTLLNDIEQYINDVNRKRIEQYKLDVIDYKQNNNNIVSFDSFKKSKNKPQMPKLINVTELQNKLSKSFSKVEDIINQYVSSDNLKNYKEQYVTTFDNNLQKLIDTNVKIITDDYTIKITDIGHASNAVSNINVQNVLKDLNKQYKENTNKLHDELVEEINNIQTTLSNENIHNFDDKLQSLKINPANNITLSNRVDLRAGKIDAFIKQEVVFLQSFALFYSNKVFPANNV